MSVGYVYEGRIHKVVDGDTLDIDVDLGFNILSRQRFHLHNVNAPEVNSQHEIERIRARDAANFVKHILAVLIAADNKVYTIETHKDKRYPRISVSVFLPEVKERIVWVGEEKRQYEMTPEMGKITLSKLLVENKLAVWIDNPDTPEVEENVNVEEAPEQEANQ